MALFINANFLFCNIAYFMKNIKCVQNIIITYMKLFSAQAIKELIKLFSFQ